VSEPVVTGSFVIEPVASTDVLMAAPTTDVTPIVTPSQGQGTILPYSYWVSAPNPSRIYVEYGTIDQFPFHGRPYGNTSDRWSRYYMGGGDSRYLAKVLLPSAAVTGGGVIEAP
jgi:hypothetical protein